MNRRMRRQMVRSRIVLNNMGRRKHAPAPPSAATVRPVGERLTDEQVEDVLEHDADRARRADRR